MAVNHKVIGSIPIGGAFFETSTYHIYISPKYHPGYNCQPTNHQPLNASVVYSKDDFKN